jgi:hypothetical protein
MSEQQKDSIDIILGRIESKIDHVNRLVDRIEASEKKLHSLDKQVIKQESRIDLLEGKVGHLRINSLYVFGGTIIFALAVVIAHLIQ